MNILDARKILYSIKFVRGVEDGVGTGGGRIFF